MSDHAGAQGEAGPDQRRPDPDAPCWRIAEVAAVLLVSDSTVRNFERAGSLPALPRMGRLVRFDPAVVMRFLRGARGPQCLDDGWNGGVQ